jgi:arylsulfatase A-like enzyme
MSGAHPNLLFVFPDQLGAWWTSPYGNPCVVTPTLERFAQLSTRFTRAYTNCPLCSPYRGSLFTGRYPSQTGITENGYALPTHEQLLANVFNDAGYATHYVGKWHLGGRPDGLRWVPPEKRGGFQRFIGWDSHHVDHYNGMIWEDDPDTPILMRNHETDSLTSIACDRLEAMGDDPFCMFVSYQAPHPPCTPPPEYKALYDDVVDHYEPNVDPDAWFEHEGWGCDYGIEEFRKRYFGEITQIDFAFGRILGALKRAGLADNTIVVFTSDHGEMNGCHGLFGKGQMYDESIRVPLLIRVPGATGKRVIDTPVQTVDFFSTLPALCGIENPNSREGQSFADLVLGASADTDRPIIVEYHDLCAIRGDWKLVAARDSLKPIALYNLVDDPYEQRNRIEDPDAANPCAALLADLRAWCDRMPSA